MTLFWIWFAAITVYGLMTIIRLLAQIATSLDTAPPVEKPARKKPKLTIVK